MKQEKERIPAELERQLEAIRPPDINRNEFMAGSLKLAAIVCTFAPSFDGGMGPLKFLRNLRNLEPCCPRCARLYDGAEVVIRFGISEVVLTKN